MNCTHNYDASMQNCIYCVRQITFYLSIYLSTFMVINVSTQYGPFNALTIRKSERPKTCHNKVHIKGHSRSGLINYQLDTFHMALHDSLLVRIGLSFIFY